jgi:hypothetical protein
MGEKLVDPTASVLNSTAELEAAIDRQRRSEALQVDQDSRRADIVKTSGSGYLAGG